MVGVSETGSLRSQKAASRASSTAEGGPRLSRLLPRPATTSGARLAPTPPAAPAGVPTAQPDRPMPTRPAVCAGRSPLPAPDPVHDRRTGCTSRPALAQPSAGLPSGGGPSPCNTKHRPAFRTGRCPLAPPSGRFDSRPAAGDNLAPPYHTLGRVPARLRHRAVL